MWASWPSRAAPIPRRTASTPPTCSATSTGPAPPTWRAATARSPRTRPSDGTGWRRSTTGSCAGRTAPRRSRSTRAASSSTGWPRPPRSPVATSSRTSRRRSRHAAEQALAQRRRPARSGGFAADSAAAVVLDVTDGAVVAAASYPAYDPKVWTGGITQANLDALRNPAAGTPLRLAGHRRDDAAGLDVQGRLDDRGRGDGRRPRRAVRLHVDVPGGGPGLRQLRVPRLRRPRRCSATSRSRATRSGTGSRTSPGSRRADSPRRTTAATRSSPTAKAYGLGVRTGIDLPGEVAGRVPDRVWKRSTWEDTKDQTCARAASGYPDVAATDPARADYLKALAVENCDSGWQYRAGDEANFAIGQGDVAVTPLQLARVYAAVANGGTLWVPQVAAATQNQDGSARDPDPAGGLGDGAADAGGPRVPRRSAAGGRDGGVPRAVSSPGGRRRTTRWPARPGPPRCSASRPPRWFAVVRAGHEPAVCGRRHGRAGRHRREHRGPRRARDLGRVAGGRLTAGAYRRPDRPHTRWEDRRHELGVVGPPDRRAHGPRLAPWPGLGARAGRPGPRQGVAHRSVRHRRRARVVPGQWRVPPPGTGVRADRRGRLPRDDVRAAAASRRGDHRRGRGRPARRRPVPHAGRDRRVADRRHRPRRHVRRAVPRRRRSARDAGGGAVDLRRGVRRDSGAMR